jgi:hypothetical protein
MTPSYIRHKINIIKSYYFCHRYKEFNYQHEINTVDVGFKKVTTYGTFNCPIEQLRASIPTNNGKVLIKIEDAPTYHFMTALANKRNSESGEKIYYDYLCYRDPNTNQESFDRTKQIKKNLVESIRSDLDLDVCIVTRPPRYDRESKTHVMKIYDGLHRSTILRAMGVKHVKCMAIF